MKRRMRLLVFIVPVSVLLLAGSGPHPVTADFIQNLTNGVRMAGKLFGIDTISDVADLVAKGFSQPGFTSKPEASAPTQQQAANMMGLMWKMLGMDGSKLGALVMNALIFVAHVIATNLGTFRKPTSNQISKEDVPKPDDSTILQSESPLEWLQNNPSKQFRSMLGPIREGNITDYLEMDLQNLEHAVPEDVGCIKLLMCKLRPFIWKMQDVVRQQFAGNAENSPEPADESKNILETISKSVPNMKEFQENAARCETNFKHCVSSLDKA
ncbi:uncharacterized protein LOC129720946 [Wyeomyia smithii]|uniref:uncharacterized protein LOC129720946 n=1 Tax=Wyeomyia smithii TaxID=174621 RepID=UPI002467DEFC|nr:uncharacterized protein LOC129720946 [Wyeomyia smithii]XP_055528880.1 uncharacterized protein LOC129720946 [Wyeomyia smithii]XP_055528881.1 uncharacterized protein LOC129720946 [Wyeomyia smithii]